MEFEKLNQFDYVSVQPRLGGLDEVQQLFLSYVTGCHNALSGPPGVGKTLLIDEFAAKIKQKLISRVMGPKVNESLLISYPDLVSHNGTSVTVTRLGLLAKALKQDCIYFADEIDRLTEDNQKLHNSAFDNRRSVTMRDGTVVKGGKNFYGVIAYNPTQGLKNDLESALADRFVHINFDYYPPEVQSMISLRQSGLAFEGLLRDKVSWKGIFYQSEKEKTIQFFDIKIRRKSVILVDPYRNKVIDLSKVNTANYRNKLFVYLRYESSIRPQGLIEPCEFKLTELSLKLAEFCSDLRNLAKHGTHQLGQDVLSHLQNSGEAVDFKNLRLHIPSSRIHQAALKQYDYLINRIGYPATSAQAYIAHMIINQAGYGKFGTTKIGRSTNRELFTSLAAAKGLLPMRKQRTFSKPSQKKKGK